MKNVLRLLLIAYLFFVSLCNCVYSIETNIPTFLHDIDKIESVNSNNAIYNENSNFEKFLVPVSVENQSFLCQKNNNLSFSFGGFKDCLTPASHQFLLLLSYIYNKSYLVNENYKQNLSFLTEIFPNAP